MGLNIQNLQVAIPLQKQLIQHTANLQDSRPTGFACPTYRSGVAYISRRPILEDRVSSPESGVLRPTFPVPGQKSRSTRKVRLAMSRERLE
jgi:hypothetical protein